MGLAARLRAAGHEAILAVQHLRGWPAGLDLWQAPLWPGQVVSQAQPHPVPPATFGDILARLGIGDAGATRDVLSAWDGLLAAIRPQAVAAEFAPGLLLAAHGRVPTLALGSGFTLPPAHLAAFPSLTGARAVADEAPLLAEVNAALRTLGLAPRPALPAIMAADRTLTAIFAELDPYAAHRTGPYGAPTATLVETVDGPRDEIFVYMNGAQPRPAGFWQGLATCGLPVRVHDPRLSPGDAATLEAAGITVEPAPVPFAKIAARSRLVLSHCGIGFTCSALLAGLPQVVAPYDLEKQLNGLALERAGWGVRIEATSYDATAFAALLRRAAADEALHARVRAAAPMLRARMALPAVDEAAAALAALA